jgi:5-aminolevulinate synthase
MPSETHIVPVIVNDSEKCKEASDLLLAEHGSAAPNGCASRRPPTMMTR